MIVVTPVTNADKPVLTANFTPFLNRLGSSAVTVSSCSLICELHPASDTAYPDVSASSRLDGAATVNSPYVLQRLANLVEGADYVVKFNATFSDGSKESIHVRQPCRARI